MGSRFVTIRKFSETWGIPEKTLRNWIRDRKIPTVKLNGRRLIDVREIEETLDRLLSESRSNPHEGSG